MTVSMVFEGDGEEDCADDEARFDVLEDFEAAERDAEAARRGRNAVFPDLGVADADREEAFFFGLAFRARAGLEAVFGAVFFDGTEADSLWFALSVFAIGAEGRTEDADVVS